MNLPVIVEHTPEEWADRIRPHLAQAVSEILAAGRELIVCKADVGHGGFLRTVELLHISEAKARMLMTVARHEVLANRYHGNDLPTSWRTLYELSRLPPAQLEAAIEAGVVRPDLERKDAQALVAAYLGKSGMPRPHIAQAPMGFYSVLYVDPPWRYEHAVSDSRRIENQYPTMTLEEICALPVPAADDAVLFLWATNPKLAEALTVVEAWGFTYRTNMAWVKDRIGMGYYARQQHELLFICRRGDMPTPPVQTRPSSVFYAPRSQHSAKPPEFYDLIERMYPEAAKVELFAREPRLGWDSWGNEAEVA